MAKDALGNELTVGALVHITLNTPHVVGRVAHIAEPSAIGLATGEGRPVMQQAGTVVMVVEIPATFTTERDLLGNVVCVVEPEAMRAARRQAEREAAGSEGGPVLVKQ